MALDVYKQKRNFARTPEPRPRVAAARCEPIFVVQEHHASRLHYDFRLEADGVLKSWAVPKQPTLNPAVKRLAAQVEDHPLAYADFSGTIPEGQYGAGVVTIWDKGTYENILEGKPRAQTVTEGIEAGHVEVSLHGRKLKGGFALIRMRQGRRKKDYWLLIKMKDKQARPDPTSGANPVTAKAGPGSRPVFPSDTTPAARRPGRSRSSTSSSVTFSRPRQARPRAVEFTHEDKVMFPAAGITKGEVLRFYEQIAPRLLPHLHDRPVTVERLPEGLDGQAAPHFWQKNTPSYYPSWIPRIELPSETGKSVQYALVNDRETLLYLVNQGALTFHVWFSRVEDLDWPDFVLFDLDPGQASFAEVMAVAKQLHVILEAQHIAALVKTSGKSGLHVLAPWAQAGGYDEAREWALHLARQVITELPHLATVERRKNKRQRKAYIDVMQNARGHHGVPPYVLRPVPQATVSTPLQWRELTPQLRPQQFTLPTIVRRLAKDKTDPFAPLVKFYRTKDEPSGSPYGGLGTT
jgi:bifunctional non-homologous end joining protein LigD